MNTPLPFGLPLSTALYMAVYLITLIIHVVFMSYVIAGTGYLAIASAARLRKGSPASPAFSVLRDWMPAAVSAAVTAGVAPLLLVQILYQKQFYTANLMLFNRWMSILPVLIVAAYLLYILKAHALQGKALLRFVIATTCFICFAFVGYSWTENHILSVQSQSNWNAFYASGSQIYYEPQLVPRLLLWAFGAMPVFIIILGWQLHWKHHHGQHVAPEHTRRLSLVALTGCALAGIAAIAWMTIGGALVQRGIFSSMAGPYALLAVLAVAAMAWAFYRTLRLGTFTRRWLTLASAAGGVAVLGMCMVREAIRVGQLGVALADTGGLNALFARHEQAASVSGLLVFLFFFAANAAACAACVLLVRSGRTHLTTPDT